MREKFEKLFFSKRSLALFTVLSAVGLLLSYSVRYGYVFVDSALFDNAAFAYFIFTVLSTSFLFTMLVLKIMDNPFPTKKPVMACLFVGELAGILTLIYFAVVFITEKGTNASTVWYLCKEALPFWCAVVFGTFFLFIFPTLKNINVKKIISVLSVCVLAFVTYASLFPVSRYTFTSGPVVFDDGKGGYSIVFSTNDKGTGFVDYSYNGENIRVYDENNGRKNGQSTIHTVTLPKAHLSGNTYKIGSTRVIDELSYGGRTGKTITSTEYTFNDSFDDKINVLCVSDWHTYNSKAETAVKNLKESYQAVVLLGDCAAGLMSDKEIVHYILQFGFDLTNGSMPVIYTRGNHETRGTAAVRLADCLGLDNFYYTTALGDYEFIVLDSCEDKEDSHPEYGGMIDYKQYRTKMVKWLESLQNEDNAKTVVFSHSKEICIEEDLSSAAFQKLNSMNVSLLISGHEHIFDFDSSSSIPTLVDGGINSNGKGTFTASLMKLSPKGIEILCADNNGNTVLKESVEWQGI